MNSDRLQHLLQSAKSKRVAVVGDVMLDRFIYGNVTRISPEAPVPVVRVTGEAAYPGGAANVARNLRPFCDGVFLCGVVGRDAGGGELCRLLGEEDIETGGLLCLDAASTIVKTRVIARHQQVVRVDREKPQQTSGDLAAEVREAFGRVLEGLDGIIIEDYGKGFVTAPVKEAVLALARERNLVVTVDPNPVNPLEWTGVTAVKPNRGEAFHAAGVPPAEPVPDPLSDGPLLKVGEQLLERWKCPMLLVTLGEQGMLLFQPGRSPHHCPVTAREVYDVSGAGDTAIALFTLALCAGAEPAEAAEVSARASGIVVGKLGTATLTPKELLDTHSSQ